MSVWAKLRQMPVIFLPVAISLALVGSTMAALAGGWDVVLAMGLGTVVTCSLVYAYLKTCPLKSRKVLLIDEKGHGRAVIALQQGNSGLYHFDEHGELCALGHLQCGAYVVGLYDGQGKIRAVVSIASGLLTDINIYDNHEAHRGTLSFLAGDPPSLSFSDARGNVIFRAP